MSLFDAVEVCRKCHRTALVTKFNGNTFAAIVRILVKRLGLDFTQEAVASSLAGHIVAGVASEEEARAFRKFCESVGKVQESKFGWFSVSQRRTSDLSSWAKARSSSASDWPTVPIISYSAVLRFARQASR